MKLRDDLCFCLFPAILIDAGTQYTYFSWDELVKTKKAKGITEYILLACSLLCHR